MESIESLRQQHRNEHAQGCPPLSRHGFIKSMPLEGQAAPPWWWCLSVVCAFCAVLSGCRHSLYVDKYERYVDKYERITLR